ncbi:hypothetical protein [Spiroplasma eriocheiris]|uniref:Transmembrane protein n=1 Tax=Spiroplasma eriocheiris TaxID=315358 RepID=A0A0H3XIS3_9MOLU|nr:hypothetical protein [Spiroplasma eriocheiris]AHF57950.1 putative transmembrane protein [Spiroplasma eriocheiris CCTCC M 207170]AKM54390.1 hypothetical protein SERIO_v1c08300 [Spiroplasma eriocheiris]
MKSFGKWSISLMWITTVIILIATLAVLGKHYEGYYWDGKDIPANINDIKEFSGSGYQLIGKLGLGKVMSLAQSGSFIWGYTSNIEVNDQWFDLKTWVQGHSDASGVIQWPEDYELANGTNFAQVTGGIMVALLVAVPVLILLSSYVTVRMVKAMTRPYSIEYIDARKALKKNTKKSKKAIKKIKTEIKHGVAPQTDLQRTIDYWDKNVSAAQKEFDHQKELHQERYQKQPNVKNLKPQV